MILANEAPAMLAGTAEEEEAIFFVLGRDHGGDRQVLCDLEEARALVETGTDLSGLIQKFLRMTERKA